MRSPSDCWHNTELVRPFSKALRQLGVSDERELRGASPQSLSHLKILTQSPSKTGYRSEMREYRSPGQPPTGDKGSVAEYRARYPMLCQQSGGEPALRNSLPRTTNAMIQAGRTRIILSAIACKSENGVSLWPAFSQSREPWVIASKSVCYSDSDHLHLIAVKPPVLLGMPR